jgi:hypothetical protein
LSLPTLEQFMTQAVDHLANGIQDHPPLPAVLPESSRRGASGTPLLADGCYFIAYGQADGFVWFQGTMRVESRSGTLSASGDLYSMPEGIGLNPHGAGKMPVPGAGIPIFPIADYSYYLRVTQIEASEAGFTLSFEASRFLARIVKRLDGPDATQWLPPDAFTAQMRPATAPAGDPAAARFFFGDVLDAFGSVIGQLQMEWVSDNLRRAVIEIDRVPYLELPLNNGAGADWQTVFAHLGWEITVDVSDSDIAKDGGPAWNAEEAHAMMLARRRPISLDVEWRYHILVVREIAFQGEQRGFMYDLSGRNGFPREGLLLAADYVFPADQPRWGPLKGTRAGDSMPTYFRTCAHELGHAFGLGHNNAGFGFMRPTDGIADGATAEDEHKLRHWPDVVVRPGGTPYDTGPFAPISD